MVRFVMSSISSLEILIIEMLNDTIFWIFKGTVAIFRRVVAFSGGQWLLQGAPIFIEGAGRPPLNPLVENTDVG